MGFYRYRDLRVIGYVGPDLREGNDLKVPKFYLPTVETVEDKLIIIEYEQKSKGIISSQQYAAEELYWFPDVAHSITRINPKRAAKKDHYWYFAEESREAEFLPEKKVFRRLVKFSDLKRKRGDEKLRLGDNAGALTLYERGASVSQTSRDYARMLLCGLSPQRERRIHGFIEQIGDDLEEVVERVRLEIFKKK